MIKIRVVFFYEDTA